MDKTRKAVKGGTSYTMNAVNSSPSSDSKVDHTKHSNYHSVDISSNHFIAQSIAATDCRFIDSKEMPPLDKALSSKKMCETNGVDTNSSQPHKDSIKTNFEGNNQINIEKNCIPKDDTDSPLSPGGLLRSELEQVKAQLLQKEEQCEKLTKLHDQTGLELQDLTASLFEEANNMVQEANIKRMATEKKLDEANSKIEILQAEVTALKTLVITSTPSSPNPHLNPQIDKTKQSEFTKGHRRSTSHHNFVKEFPCAANGSAAVAKPSAACWSKDVQVEPFYMELFLSWKRQPCLNPETPFIALIVGEDILPCLHFANESLTKVVLEGVFNNTLTVEPLLSCSLNSSTLCSLTQIMRPCHYCMKLDGSEKPFTISQAARNRIIAVCDLLTYLRYITQGLIKCDELGMYLEITKLRKNMCLARLGLSS